MNLVDKFTFTFAPKIGQTNALALNFDACPMHSAPRALDAPKSSACALDLFNFTRKSKCAFINLQVKPYLRLSFAFVYLPSVPKV